MDSSSFFNSEAIELGREAHKWIENLYKEKFPINEDFPSGKMAIALVEWLYSQDIECLYSETIGYNKTLQYAGTVDFIGKNKNNEIYLIDFKFANAIYPSNFIQMEALRNFSHIGKDRIITPHHILLLQYHKKNKQVIPLEVIANKVIFTLFKNALGVWKYRQKRLIKKGKI